MAAHRAKKPVRHDMDRGAVGLPILGAVIVLIAVAAAIIMGTHAGQPGPQGGPVDPANYFYLSSAESCALDSASSSADYESCFNNNEVQVDSVDDCTKLSNTSSTADLCAVLLAGKPASCSGLSSDTQQEFCSMLFALKTRDVEGCKALTNEVFRTNCLARISQGFLAGFSNNYRYRFA